MVQLKESAELQGEENGRYLKGTKFWVKWSGEVSESDNLPIVKVMHSA